MNVRPKSTSELFVRSVDERTCVKTGCNERYRLQGWHDPLRQLLHHNQLSSREMELYSICSIKRNSYTRSLRMARRTTYVTAHGATAVTVKRTEYVSQSSSGAHATKVLRETQPCVVRICARNYDGMQELRERGGSPKAIGAHLTPPFTPR